MPNPLFIKPERCPLCKAEWVPYEKSGPGEDVDLMRRSRCPNYETCYFFLDEIGFVDEGVENYQYFLHKDLPNGVEIWWDLGDQCCEIKYQSKYCKIPFTPPYEVDEKRLKIFLLFS